MNKSAPDRPATDLHKKQVITLDNVHTFNVKAETLPVLTISLRSVDADYHQVLAKGLDTVTPSR
jgi:hypothetical protein